jgi:hypothetical protein
VEIYDHFIEIKNRWIKNYEKIYGETPAQPAADSLYPFFAQKIPEIGADRILAALDAGMSELFCIERGYRLKLFASTEVVSRLLDKPKYTEPRSPPWLEPIPYYDLSDLIAGPGNTFCPF